MTTRAASGTQTSITRVVQALMALQGESREELAVAINLSMGSLGHRMTGRVDWTIEDVVALARHFNVNTDVLLHAEPRELLGIGVSKSKLLLGELVAA